MEKEQETAPLLREVSATYGNSSDSVDTRVLFSSLLGSHENWGNETCDRSLYSE
jgi:hypothetical protein